MKRFLLFILAAVIGAGLSLGGYMLFQENNLQTIRVEHENSVHSRPTAFFSNANGAALDFTGAAQNVMPAAVHIRSSQTMRSASSAVDPFQHYFGDEFFEHFFGPQKPRRNTTPEVRVGTGSGVIIKENGYIVTNSHVIKGADDIEVTLNDNRTFKASLIGTDPSTDIALLKIDEDELPFITFANSDEVLVGEWVLAVGNPFNLNATVTAGIVSAKGRNINILRDKYAIESFIQTDAAINPGNSGGALVNLNGELVGINTAIASPTGAYSGYGFAIPSNIVKKVLSDLEEFGVVQRGFIGVMIRSIDADLAKEKELDVNEGVYVDSLVEDGAAAVAGLKTGDVILNVEGIAIKTSPELQEIIARHKPGDVVKITVDRKGKRKEFDVVLRNKNGTERVINKVDIDVLTKLGIDIEDIDKDELKKLNISGGVKVTNIGSGKISKYTEMKKGFIITMIDKTPVNNTEDFQNIMNKKEGGILLEGVYPDYPGVFYYAFGM